MRNLSDKICTENQNTHFVRFFFLENRAAYDTKWKNMVEPEGSLYYGASALNAG
jgi:hypothetical protein